MSKILVEKYRPDSIDGYVGNEHIKEIIKQFINNESRPNLLLSGPPGTGKTTLAKILYKNIDCDYLMINASDENGIDTIREKIKGFCSVASFQPIKLVVLDECLEENTPVTVLRKGEIQNIPIKDLDDVNDLVKSFNVKKNRIEWKPFYLWDKGEHDLYEIEFENGEIIQCTEDHKWYVKDNEGIKVVKTIELSQYMEIFNPKG